MKTKALIQSIVAAAALSVFASCSSVGPNRLPRDHFDYGAAIRGSGQEQLLSNIVGLRYLDAPTFVNVSSVINQYELAGDVSGGVGFNSILADVPGDNTGAVNAGVRWADRPSITYVPLSGRDFAESLMTPLSPEALFALVQSGWPTELLLRMTVRSINGVENQWAAPANRRQADPRFNELLATWSRLRKSRAIGLRRDDTGEENSRIVVYQAVKGTSAGARKDLATLFSILKLNPSRDSYPLSYGLVPDEPDEIVVLTASLLEIMNELAWRVEVPEEHIEDGYTSETFYESKTSLSPLVRIRSSKEKPSKAYAAVRSRDYWFYIDDRDVASKRTFAVLQLMFSLTDSGESGRGPIVSIGQ